MTETQGLVIVNTGNGKGKTTAALGMGMRAWGQGLRVLVVQFIKGSWKYGELKAIEKLGENYVIRPMGKGFVKDGTEEESQEHKLAAVEALAAAKRAVSSGEWDMVILDEINYAVHFELVSLEAVMEVIEAKLPAVHMVLTGRAARPEIIDRADLVTEMKEIKHPSKKGIPAQKGVEF